MGSVWKSDGHAVSAESPTVGEIENTTVGGTGNTIVATIPTIGVNVLTAEIAVATQALDVFIISGRPHAKASYQTLFSTASEYINCPGDLIGTSGDLTTIAAGATGFFKMDCRGYESIQLSASAAADSATVTVRARLT
jgi:hypothetical protein